MRILPQVSLFVRFPTPGVAKTRLIPALGAKDAASVHRRLVERTLATVRASALPFEIRTTGAPPERFARWLGPDVALTDQGDGDLGARLARVPTPTILLGADVPGLTSDHLLQAADGLARKSVVVGPTTDGGYFLLGLRAPALFLFDKMPWGSGTVFAETMRRLTHARLDAMVLDLLDDVDRPEDLAGWRELLP